MLIILESLDTHCPELVLFPEFILISQLSLITNNTILAQIHALVIAAYTP